MALRLDRHEIHRPRRKSNESPAGFEDAHDARNRITSIPPTEECMVDDAVLAMKKAAGEAAARRVQSGMLVGLGTGPTAIHAIHYLGQRLRDRELTDIRGIPTSFQASVLARELRIPLASLDE